MRSDYIRRHQQTCQVLRNKKNEGDAVGVNDSQTVTGSENIRRQQQTCQVLKKKENEGDADGVNDNQTVTKSETRPKKRKVDCLQESKDIPTFEEAEFSGVKLLTEETLLRMMEMMKITYENRARILKLEKRFHKKSVSREPLPKGVISELLQRGVFLD